MVRRLTDATGRASRGPAGDGGGFARVAAVLSAVITGWAIVGGLLLAGLALMTAGSALSNLFFSRPWAPEIELTRHLIAIIIFTMLPYCQLVGANITVDIFTEGMGTRAKAAMGVLSSLLAAAFAVLLLRQMSLGFESYLSFVELTPVLRLPLWTAFPPILLSLALLLAAALLTFADGMRVMRGRPSALPHASGSE